MHQILFISRWCLARPKSRTNNRLRRLDYTDWLSDTREFRIYLNRWQNAPKVPVHNEVKVWRARKRRLQLGSGLLPSWPTIAHRRRPRFDGSFGWLWFGTLAAAIPDFDFVRGSDVVALALNVVNRFSN